MAVKFTHAPGGDKLFHLEKGVKLLIFFLFNLRNNVLLWCTHLGSTVCCSDPSDKAGSGAQFSTKWNKKTRIPLFCCLELPFEQQLVIKLTSQQKCTLGLASQSIVVHSGGNSFFQRIPGQKPDLAQFCPEALAVRNRNACCAAVLVLTQGVESQNLLIPGSHDGQRQICFLFLMLCHFLAIFTPRRWTTARPLSTEVVAKHFAAANLRPCWLTLVHLLKGSVS